MTQIKCTHCGETKNLHFNYAYELPDVPIESILCNECGEITENTTKEVTNEFPSNGRSNLLPRCGLEE
jgi:formate dehydrogenase maturation protein FdhE